ncbi:hypothetical protein VPH35_012287 [Triticum aestivum]
MYVVTVLPSPGAIDQINLLIPCTCIWLLGRLPPPPSLATTPSTARRREATLSIQADRRRLHALGHWSIAISCVKEDLAVR